MWEELDISNTSLRFPCTRALKCRCTPKQESCRLTEKQSVLRSTHVVDTHLGSLKERVVLVEQVSEVGVVPVFKVRDQVHANVDVEGLEAGRQRNFTSGCELCPYQACLSGHFSPLPRCCFSLALRLCPYEKR